MRPDDRNTDLWDRHGTTIHWQPNLLPTWNFCFVCEQELEGRTQ
jgi:hypothetical protein